MYVSATDVHYICFINEFFHSDYMKVDLNLANDNFGGLYGAVRSGLVNEYFIKNISKIEIDSATVISCGITYDPNNNPDRHDVSGKSI